MYSKINLANNLRGLRLVEGLSLNAYAKKHGLSKSTMQRIDKGGSITLDTLDFISWQIHVPVSALLSEEIPSKQLGFVVEIFKSLDWYSKLSSGDRNIIEDASRLVSQVLYDNNFDEV